MQGFHLMSVWQARCGSDLRYGIERRTEDLKLLCSGDLRPEAGDALGDSESDLMKGEIFGPILPIIGVDSLSDAIAFVNSREKPLATYVFSENREERERVFREVPSGGATANHTLMHILAPGLPFGGVGDSGMGAYHGKWGFECFSHRKATLVMRSCPDLKLIYPPYSERAKKLLRRLA